MIPWGESALKQANDAIEEDAHPVKPFHDVLRSHGFKPRGSEHIDGVRHNTYVKPNPGGGEEKVVIKHTQKMGPDFGKTDTETHSGDPEAGIPRYNNSPEKLDRNIHAQSYRAPEGLPSKMKPGEIKEYAKKIKE